jgi:hypothetical protein
MKSCYCTYWTYWTYNTTVPTTAPKVEHSKPLAISPAAPGDATTGMTSLLVPWALAMKPSQAAAVPLSQDLAI